MKIAVVGAGAMGSLYGARLAMAENEVTMVDVVPAVVSTIGERGLILEDSTGVNSVRVRACYGKDLKESPDLIILFTKTMYSRSALDSIKDVIGANSCVISVQNGLGNVELISEYLPLHRIIVGTTIFDSDLIEPGYIRTSGHGMMNIMSADGVMRDLVTRMNSLFNASGLTCRVVENVMVAIWEKVAFNAATNTMAAVTRLPDGCTVGTKETKELACKIAKEVIMTANACGIPASADGVLSKLDLTVAEHGGHFPSMAQDVFKKRGTEIESINGAVMKMAQKHGLDVPYTETMYRLVRTIEQNYDKQVLG